MSTNPWPNRVLISIPSSKDISFADLVSSDFYSNSSQSPSPKSKENRMLSITLRIQNFGNSSKFYKFSQDSDIDSFIETESNCSEYDDTECEQARAEGFYSIASEDFEQNNLKRFREPEFSFGLNRLLNSLKASLNNSSTKKYTNVKAVKILTEIIELIEGDPEIDKDKVWTMLTKITKKTQRQIRKIIEIQSLKTIKKEAFQGFAKAKSRFYYKSNKCGPNSKPCRDEIVLEKLRIFIKANNNLAVMTQRNQDILTYKQAKLKYLPALGKRLGRKSVGCLSVYEDHQDDTEKTSVSRRAQSDGEINPEEIIDNQ